jgi:hypothetical protein
MADEGQRSASNGRHKCGPCLDDAINCLYIFYAFFNAHIDKAIYCVWSQGPDVSRPIGINLSNGCVFRERNTDSEGFRLPMKVENRRETAAVIVVAYLSKQDSRSDVPDYLGNCHNMGPAHRTQ